MQMSVMIRMRWSGGVTYPPISADDRWYLMLWLQRWLQTPDLKELGRLELEVRNQSITKFDFDNPGTG